MDAKFRALRADDIKDIGSVIYSNAYADPYAQLDYVPYRGDPDFTDIERFVTELHCRKVIQLSVPTFNHVLGRSGASLLRQMLDVDSKLWKQIISLEVLYDVENEEYIHIDDAYIEGGKFLYGAEIAEHLIKKLDIGKALIDCVYRALGNVCSSSKNPRDYFKVNTNKKGFHIGDKFYVEPADNADDALKRGLTLDAAFEQAKDVLFKNGDTRFSYLLNMAPDKSALFGMLNYYIVVVPKEMRPQLDSAVHKLTKMYTKVLRANYEMSLVVDSDQIKSRQAAYLRLETAVRRLQYKNQDSSSDVKPDDLSVLERVKSKKGQIRMRNLGKRQDYSGRAVVCINPYLPLDFIRVPKTMLPKLLEYHTLPYLAENIKNNDMNKQSKRHLSNVYDRLRLSSLDTNEAREEMLNIIRKEQILDKVPMVLGRQPTLHKQSLQGFHVEESELQAIEVNPLVCPAFNMDFDGDQAHLEVPLSNAAIKEVNDLVLTTQNLFLPKTGECTIEPRQDMLYGLWVCTNNEYKIGDVKAKYSSVYEAYLDVINHRISVYDTIAIAELGTSILAGDAAFMACFPKGSILPRGSVSTNGIPCVKEINKHTITDYVEWLLRTDSFGNFILRIGSGRIDEHKPYPESFVGAINRLVELGFKVARLYPPNLSLVGEKAVLPEYDNSITQFYDDMQEIDLLYNLGFEIDDNYKLVFDENLKKLTQSRQGYSDYKGSDGSIVASPADFRDGVEYTKVEHPGIIEKLGKDSGYVKLSVSGARGSKSNLMQAFSIKGQVKKNDTEAFDALLPNSYASQLTPMEHFVAAYGGRQGQIDKSLKTGDTGYAMRQMWHATQDVVITCDDCGTTDGIPVSKRDLAVFSDAGDSASVQKYVTSTFAHALTGRYTAGKQTIETSNGTKTLAANTLISSTLAQELADDAIVNSVIIRSPIKCKNPCCAKCYGTEWSTRKKPVVGVPVGIIAAQAIGEPGTQLTMKQFQTGGVASKSDVTSAFDKVDNYIHVADLAKMSKAGTYLGYDPLAWASGRVIETPASDVRLKVVSIEGASKKTITVPKEVVLKDVAVKGEGLSYKHGDYDLHEMLEYNGIDKTQLYLAFKLQALYSSDVSGIKMVHFEMLVACMTRYMITSTDRSDLMVGQYATARELYAGNTLNTEYIPRLISVKRLVHASHDALDNILMENHVFGLSRACLLGMTDSLTKPLNRMLFSKSTLSGSNVKGFVEARKENI